MQNTVAPLLDGIAGRLVSGFVNGVSDHPFATCALLAALMVAISLLLLDPANERPDEWTEGE